MYSIVKFKISDKEHTQLAFDIRNAVFVKEQNVDPNIEIDCNEASAFHYLAYEKNIPVGAARWRFTLDGVKLERFAVVKSYRGKGVGTAILHAVLEDIDKSKMVYLHSQIQSISFYEKNGFAIFREEVIDIGNGFVMDDFVMRKSLLAL